jgi:hypothetical protein
VTDAAAARGCAFGDYLNRGIVDVVVNCVNSVPQLLRCEFTSDATRNRNWIKIRTVGTKSNRAGIGARLIVTAQTDPKAAKPMVQIDEVRSGGSYYSQNDLRIHFGLDQAKKVDSVEIRWPSGAVDTLKDLPVNHLYVIQEGGKILKSDDFNSAKGKSAVRS